ncbi:MAG: 3'-5' exonuclease [Bacteroidales bacterium]
MMQYISSITRDKISLLPVEKYDGRIVVIEREEDVADAAGYLSGCAKVGFDTETRPCFGRGPRYKIALMQVADDDVCFLFRLNRIGLPKALKDFLQNNSVLKIGLSLRDDFRAIHKCTNIEPANFLDLQHYVNKFGIEEKSLQKIYAILFDSQISKKQQLSNWEADELSEFQKQYAALDAWACLKIYNTLTQVHNGAEGLPEAEKSGASEE